MQSGTTGINTTRVYNPIKQAHDHDAQGQFVRRWLKPMRQVPDTFLFQPWLMSQSQRSALGLPDHAIATPVVDLEQATREAKAKLHARRQQDDVKAAKAQVVEKHGSRLIKPRPKRPSSKGSLAQQTDFGF